MGTKNTQINNSSYFGKLQILGCYRSEDIQLEQSCPEETVAPSQVWREKIVIHEAEAPPEPPTTPSSESQDDWENGESRSEDLKTPNALPRGKHGSYPVPFNYLK